MPNLTQKDRWFNDMDKAWDFLESRGYICGFSVDNHHSGNL